MFTENQTVHTLTFVIKSLEDEIAERRTTVNAINDHAFIGPWKRRQLKREQAAITAQVRYLNEMRQRLAALEVANHH
jgi:hypothetical protein